MTTSMTPATATDFIRNSQLGASGLGENTTCIVLRHGALGVTRKVDTAKVDIIKNPETMGGAAAHVVDEDVDKRMLSASKYLFESNKFGLIDRFDAATVKWLESVTVSFSVFKEGVRFAPPSRAEEIDLELAVRQQQRNVLVQNFLDEWEVIVANAKKSLGSLFDAADYPDRSEAERRFRMEWYFFEMKSPGNQGGQISHAAMTRMREKLAVKYAEAEQQIAVGMCEAGRKMVAHLLDKLSGTEDGKVKKFHESSITNITKFLETYNDKIQLLRNHADLEALGNDMRELLKGVDGKAMKSNPDIRKTVIDGFQKIQATMDTLIVNKGRAVSLDDVSDGTVN